MDEYNSALESFRGKNKDCIVKQLEYGEYMQANEKLPALTCGVDLQ